MPLIVDNDKILNNDAIFVVGGGSTNNNKKIEIFGRKNNTHTKKIPKKYWNGDEANLLTMAEAGESGALAASW